MNKVSQNGALFLIPQHNPGKEEEFVIKKLSQDKHWHGLNVTWCDLLEILWTY